MTDALFPDAAPARPGWLMTLADLALLLVGFFVLLQANQQLDRGALARGLRAGFGVEQSQPRPQTPPAAPRAMPVAAAGLMAFAPGSAALPGPTAGIVAWAREAVRDPRVAITVTGSVDGSAADVDPTTGSGAVLAADRARALAAAIAATGAVPGARLSITNGRAGQRAALATIGFAGRTP